MTHSFTISKNVEVRDREEKRKIFCSWFRPQVAPVVRIWSQKGQEQGVSPTFSHTGAQDQVLGQFLTAFPGAFSGHWTGSGTSGSPTSIHIGCRCHRQWLSCYNRDHIHIIVTPIKFHNLKINRIKSKMEITSKKCLVLSYVQNFSKKRMVSSVNMCFTLFVKLFSKEFITSLHLSQLPMKVPMLSFLKI